MIKWSSFTHVINSFLLRINLIEREREERKRGRTGKNRIGFKLSISKKKLTI